MKRLDLRRAAAALTVVLAAGCGSSEEADDGGAPAVFSGEPVPVAGEGAPWQAEAWPEEVELLEAHFLAVGQGECTLFKLPNGKRILVDCGSTGGDPAEVRAYVRAMLPDRHLDTLAITRPEPECYRFLPYVLEGFNVDEVLLVGPREAHDGAAFATSPTEAEDGAFAAWLEQFVAGEHLRVVTPDDTSPHGTPSPLFHSGDTEFYVLSAGFGSDAVPADEARDAASMVLMVTYRGFDAILASGATEHTERDVLSRYPLAWLDVELLKLARHGADGSSNTPGWLDALTPLIAVASCPGDAPGLGAGYRRALERHTGELTSEHHVRWWAGGTADQEDTAEAIFTTGTNGTLVVQSDGERVRLHTWR